MPIKKRKWITLRPSPNVDSHWFLSYAACQYAKKHITQLHMRICRNLIPTPLSNTTEPHQAVAYSAVLLTTFSLIPELHGLSWSLSVRRSHQLCDIVIAWDYMLYLRNVYQRLNVVQSPSVVVVHFHFLLGHFFKLRIFMLGLDLCCALYCCSLDMNG